MLRQKITCNLYTSISYIIITVIIEGKYWSSRVRRTTLRGPLVMGYDSFPSQVNGYEISQYTKQEIIIIIMIIIIIKITIKQV